MISISIGRNISLMRKRKKQNEEKSKILQKKKKIWGKSITVLTGILFFLEMKNIKNFHVTWIKHLQTSISGLANFTWCALWISMDGKLYSICLLINHYLYYFLSFYLWECLPRIKSQWKIMWYTMLQHTLLLEGERSERKWSCKSNV